MSKMPKNLWSTGQESQKKDLSVAPGKTAAADVDVDQDNLETKNGSVSIRRIFEKNFFAHGLKGSMYVFPYANKIACTE